MPRSRDPAVREQADGDVDQKVGLEPVRLQAFKDSLDYLMVPGSSIRLPWSVHPVPFQVMTCSCMIGKWSDEVVLTLTLGSRNGLVSFSLLAAMSITFFRVMTVPACFSTSTIVYATATP